MITKKQAKEWFNNFDKNKMGHKDSRLSTFRTFLIYGIKNKYIDKDSNLGRK